MTDPIISDELPPAIKQAAEEVEPCEAMNYGEDILPQFKEAQRAAIRRFCAAVEKEAEERAKREVGECFKATLKCVFTATAMQSLKEKL